MTRFVVIVLCAALAASAAVPAGAARASTARFDPGSVWSWDELEASLTSDRARSHLSVLREDVTLAEARFLFRQLASLDGPDALHRLADFQAEQEAWGGSFYGIIPPFPVDPDSIPSLGGVDSLVEAALFLAELRGRNREAIERTGTYPVAFTGDSLVIPDLNRAPEGFELAIDTAAIRALLALLESGEQDDAAIRGAIDRPVFREMLRHRRDLGYVPPPLPDEESLARFARRAAGREPLEMLWKWINPCNLFCMADLAMNGSAYADILYRLEQGREAFSDDVMGRIAQFAPAGTTLRERIGFGVNFGVRSWATAAGLGTNLVQFKDDYEALRTTVTHETFHRLQLRVCPVHESRAGRPARKFEDLVFWPFPDDRDTGLYEALSYIFLEGTATFAGGAAGARYGAAEAREGGRLLGRIVDRLYRLGELEVDELLSAGLRSNGPFYALGYAMGARIAERGGNGAIGPLLEAGAPAFVRAYLATGARIPGLGAEESDTLIEALDRMDVGMR